ncbi:MAG: sulfurtransferase TusA family protein [Promethearchaeota archaeon]|nr:MAG: sulfurtransferase TusA family protein [Candidatus Lokiarchaeota archaeon]
MPLENNIEKEKSNFKRIDIRGEVCPMTFVLTKLALEEVPKEHILEVLLDFPPAIKFIPENCKRQSLAKLIEIRKIESSKNEYLLKLKKT